MSTVAVELTWPQWLAAIARLPDKHKAILREMLDTQLQREQVLRNCDEAWKEIRQANAGFTEEVIADVLEAVREVRAGS